MFVPFVAVAILATTIADDSLREALQAVQQKRQRESDPLIFYPPQYLGDGQPEDIGYGYQKSISPNTVGIFEPMALPYSQLGSHDDDEELNAIEKKLQEYVPRPWYSAAKRSVFRERDPEGFQRIFPEEDVPVVMPSPFRERDKTRIQNAHNLVRNYGGMNFDDRYNTDDNDDYLSVLNQVWEKYKGEEDPEELTEADVEEILEYLAGKEDKKRQYGSYSTGYDFFNSPLGWAKRSKFADHSHKRYPETLFDERYPYKGQKRFPITKRSLSLYSSMPLERKKKSENKKTDPKVTAELNNIFDTNNNKSETKTTQPPHTTPPGQKEQTIEASATKPVEIKKKSINWSDYFGYDRRKKSSDWLVDQYAKAYGNQYDKKKRPDDMDNKMRAMEDLIVDEAIKYTGAHEGTRDSKEIQEVKDKVMAQLAAAYSLEKMRRALGEFKASIAAQKATAPASHSIPLPNLQNQNKHNENYEKKEKPESGPMEKFEKKEPHEGYNELKPRIHPSISSISTKVVEEVDGCPVLQDLEMRCRQISHLAGDRPETFLPLCNVHQICYLCGPELRASSPRECDEAFTTEAEALCGEDGPPCYEMSKRILYIAKRARGVSECKWRSNPCLAQFLAVATLRR